MHTHAHICTHIRTRIFHSFIHSFFLSLSLSLSQTLRLDSGAEERGPAELLGRASSLDKCSRWAACGERVKSRVCACKNKLFKVTGIPPCISNSLTCFPPPLHLIYCLPHSSLSIYQHTILRSSAARWRAASSSAVTLGRSFSMLCITLNRLVSAFHPGKPFSPLTILCILAKYWWLDIPILLSTCCKRRGGRRGVTVLEGDGSISMLNASAFFFSAVSAVPAVETLVVWMLVAGACGGDVFTTSLLGGTETLLGVDLVLLAAFELDCRTPGSGQIRGLSRIGNSSSSATALVWRDHRIANKRGWGGGRGINRENMKERLKQMREIEGRNGREGGEGRAEKFLRELTQPWMSRTP